MKIIQSSDYLIYFDDVRMDPYIKMWSASCGLRASDAGATISMYRTKQLEEWKAYLTQVRIFSRNIFSGRYSIIFEGEIVSRNWGDQRNDTGEIVFTCKGFYHWLDIPIPLMIGQEEQFDYIHRFRYEAQNINVNAIQSMFDTRHNIIMKDKPIRELVDTLFTAMNDGYYLNDDSSFHFAKLQDRFMVMGDVIKEFRAAGYLDAFQFVRTTQIDSFYVYLTQVLTQMMFEFYQDKDGAFRIKNPSWGDKILKAHIFDEAIIENVSGFNDWENEPTRVLVIGGQQDTIRYGAQAMGADNAMVVPMGLYIGMPGEGKYFAQNVEIRNMMEHYGVTDSSIGVSGFFDDISGNFRVSSKFGPRNWDGEIKNHQGTDYPMSVGTPLRNLGVSGEVTLANYGSSSAGNWIIIKQNILGQEYSFTYMHMQELHVKKGDFVAPGQQIGTSGNTGRSTGPHLHLEVWRGNRNSGTALDPEKFLAEMKANSTETTGTGASGNTSGRIAPGTSKQAQFMNQDLINQYFWSADKLNSWINSKAKPGSLMYNQGQAFFTAGQKTGLDPIYIIAHAAHETGWGTSRIVREKWNYYGIAAFDHNPYNSAYQWNSPADGIIKGAEWIRKNYYDRGQNTIYKMRFTPDGKHQYATDVKWPNKIADIMSGAGVQPGRAPGTFTPSNPLTPVPQQSSSVLDYLYTSPYASTGGFSYTSVPQSSSTIIKNLLEGGSGTKREKPIPIQYSAIDQLKYTIPHSATFYRDFLLQRPNGVNVNLICTIIEVASNWRERFKSINRVGLMGVNLRYIDDEANITEAQMYTPTVNIEHGTMLFNNAYKRFSNKVTFALAALYEGSMIPIQTAITEVGVEDFSKVRTSLPPLTAAFVDTVIEKFAELYDGNHLKGDPHRVFLDEFSGNPSNEEIAEDTEVKEYESSYKPVLSDEERLFKLNLKVSEQVLIRYDTNSPTGEGAMNADELVLRYAKYMMQLYRAESHGVNVSFATCLPFLRPGFNAWLEPTRTNKVFYITRINHQGSFERGAITTISGAFVRDTKSYDDIEENIFVGETSVKASDFGEVIEKKDMAALQEELKSLHLSEENIGDGRKIPVLNKLYSSAKANESFYGTMWAQELSPPDIDKKVKEVYVSAPNVVLERKKQLKKIVTDAESFFIEMLNKTKL